MSTPFRSAFAVAALAVLAGAPPALAQSPAPSYVRQVRPLLAKYCAECHSGSDPDGELDLDTYQGLLKGGSHGPVVVPGKADASGLVRNVEGKARPFMPPEKKPQPSAEEKAILRAWVAAGAKDDTGLVGPLTLPVIRPRTPLPAPVAALAYAPDGKRLVAAGRREAVFVDPAAGTVVGRLDGQTERVTALAFSNDGQWLAVASGAAASRGEVRLYRLEAGAVSREAPRTLAAHADLVLGLCFSPDGKLLATCGYDRRVKLWNVADGKLVHDLTDHSDAVYAVAFRPDGTLLATAAADRAVKVWDVATGKRLYTLGEATDWLYAVAWAPDGKYLAAAGVDRSIRVWAADASGGQLVHSVFAHEGPVVRLAYAPDGQRLYSIGEDRALKAWDAARMVEAKVYDRLGETPLSLAVRPDGKQLAVGRFDGTLTLLDEATGKVLAEPLPAKPQPPAVGKLTPPAAPRGGTFRLEIEGAHLDGGTVLTEIPGARVEALPDGGATKLAVTVTVPMSTTPGAYSVAVQTAAGKSAPLPFYVDAFPAVAEVEGNDSPRTGQVVGTQTTVVGSIGRAGDVDYYRFEAKAGQEVGIQALVPPGSKLEPVLTLTDGDGLMLTQAHGGLLGFVCPKAGAYAVGIRDRDYRGEPAMTYRLSIGELPMVTGVYPLGVPRGGETDVHLDGVFLGPRRTVRLKVPPETPPGTRLPVPLPAPPLAPALGAASVVVGEFPEVTAPQPELTLPVPGTGNGRIGKAGDSDVWRFKAKKGELLILEVHARRLGSPLDSVIEILDAAGRPLPRATLRCLSRTHTTFRDHDSTTPGIRIDAWADLAVNDYLLVGDELVRIRALPRNPDDDCQFFSAAGQRLGYLGTTPTFHPQGEPMYKVAIHPPGATFPPNGLPVVTLFYRNDDGGPGHGKDSRLVFDPPADGDYRVRVADARGVGGPLFAYRLTVRPPRPSYSVTFAPTAPTVNRGGAVPVSVTAERFDEFDGPIDVRLDGLPPGLSAPATTIPAGELTTSFALFAEPGATVPPEAPPFKLVARATIEGKEVVREVPGGRVQVADPGDLVVTLEQREVTLTPGGEARVTVKVERRNDFKGRIPLDVRGLPHGVRVLDVGLNGILITEAETTRTFVLKAEPWMPLTTHPFVVLARREGKNVEYAAPSILLRVAEK